MYEDLVSQIYAMTEYEVKLRSSYNSGYSELMNNPMTYDEYQNYLNKGLIIQHEYNNYYTTKSKLQLGKTIEEVENITDGYPIEIVKHPRYSYPVMHNHTYIEIIYVCDGSCSHFIEDEKINLNQGDLCILAPNTFHSLSVTNDETIVINILVSKNFFKNDILNYLKSEGNNILSTFIEHVLFRKRVSPYLVINTPCNSQICEYILQMYFERKKKYFQYHTCLKLYLQLLFIELVRHYDNKILVMPQIEQNEDVLAESILAYISINYNKVSLKNVAEYFGYDSKYIGRKIKVFTGKTFHNIIDDLQVEHARILMESTLMSLTEICQEVGCFDYSHLSKKFKRKFGQTPLQYRSSYNSN